MSDNVSLEIGLVDTIAAPELRDVFVDLTEVGLDQLLGEGLLRDVPIVSTFIGLLRSAGTIRDHLFFRKVAKFMLQIGEVPLDRRTSFLKELATPEEKKRFAETLLLLLDRLDDMVKPDLLGLLGKALILGQIDLLTFRRLSTALDRFNITWLSDLHSYYDSQRTVEVPRDALQEMAAAGLAGVSFGSSGIFDPMLAGGGGYRRNDLGKLFVELTFLRERG